MSEPKAVARTVDEVVPGVWTWSVHDERIDFVSTAHAVRADEGAVLIDPLPLEPEALAGLGDVAAICMTAGTHQRSTWRYRRDLGVPVYAPALSKLIDEEPDVRYEEGDVLPGGLEPVFTPGGGTTQHTLLLARDGGVAFVPDLLVNVPGRGLQITSDEYVHDPAQARRSIEKLLGLEFSVLCLNHGAPVTEKAKDAIRALLTGDER
jgi:glyoxylase-like metal-dependent hydrolase (beta-lactamase superfamily II)